MRATKTAVIVSEEQGEVDKFRKWGFDITRIERLIKKTVFELADGTRIDVDSAFKRRASVPNCDCLRDVADWF